MKLTKITAGSNFDRIRQEQADYESRRDAWNKEYNRQAAVYKRDAYQILDGVKQKILDQLSQYAQLKFDVRVERNWWSSSQGTGPTYLRCYIECNPIDSKIQGWKCELGIDEDTKEVVREYSTWGASRRITMQDISVLEESLAAVKTIMTLNWNQLLKVDVYPKQSDYISIEPSRNLSGSDRDWRAEKKFALINDLVGTNDWILCDNFEQSGYWGRAVWIKIVSQTAAMITVHVVPDRQGAPNLEYNSHNYTQRMRKSTFEPTSYDDPVLYSEQ